MIYSPVNYQMGAHEVDAAPTAPVTKEMAAKAKASLKSMRSSLKAWLKYRSINDAIAAGETAKLKSPLFKRPGAFAPPGQVMKMTLARRRYIEEQELALQLHDLLSEVFDAGQLPLPDVKANPNAAVELAQIAIAGKLPGEAPTPDAAGVIWMWPLVIVVGAIAFVITSSIRSKADVAKEREKYECIRAGHCTDSGFWLKLGAIAIVGFIVWDRLGVGAKVKGMIKGKA